MFEIQKIEVLEDHGVLCTLMWCCLRVEIRIRLLTSDTSNVWVGGG